MLARALRCRSDIGAQTANRRSEHAVARGREFDRLVTPPQPHCSCMLHAPHSSGQGAVVQVGCRVVQARPRTGESHGLSARKLCSGKGVATRFLLAHAAAELRGDRRADAVSRNRADAEPPNRARVLATMPRPASRLELTLSRQGSQQPPALFDQFCRRAACGRAHEGISGDNAAVGSAGGHGECGEGRRNVTGYAMQQRRAHVGSRAARLLTSRLRRRACRSEEALARAQRRDVHRRRPGQIRARAAVHQ